MQYISDCAIKIKERKKNTLHKAYTHAPKWSFSAASCCERVAHVPAASDGQWRGSHSRKACACQSQAGISPRCHPYTHFDATKTWRQALVLDKLPLKIKKRRLSNFWAPVETCVYTCEEKCGTHLLRGSRRKSMTDVFQEQFLGIRALFQVKMEVPVMPHTSLTSDQVSRFRVKTSIYHPLLRIRKMIKRL